MLRYLLFIVLLLALVTGCADQQLGPTLSEPSTDELPKSNFIIYPPTGDTIFTGVPIPAVGKRIDPDAVLRPREIPLKGRPQVSPAYTNIQPVKTSKVSSVLDKPSVVIPGKGKTPLPQKVLGKGVLVPTQQPQPVPSLPARLKDDAIYDMQFLNVEQGMNVSDILSMLEDSRGHFWLGTNGGGVIRYDGYNFMQYQTKDGLSNNFVFDVLEDSQGNLWFATLNGLNRYDGQQFTQYHTDNGLLHNWVWDILEDRQGDLWLATRGGLSRYDGQYFTHYTTREGLLSNNARALLEDSQGHLWISTDGGMCLYNPDAYQGQGSFSQYPIREFLPNDGPNSILKDSQGNLWLDLTLGGVGRYDGRQFTSFTTQEGLLSNFVLAMLEDKEKYLWFATDGGVSRYDGRDFTHYTSREGLPNIQVRVILEDSQGHLWFGTKNGVSRFDKRSFTHYSSQEGLLHFAISAIQEDSQGHLWLGTNGGVSRYDGRHFTHFTTREGLLHQSVNTIMKDRQGHLWFGTNGGASRFDPEAYGGRGGFTHYTQEEGLLNNNVREILEDSQGNIWFGTAGGACRYDGESFTQYTFESGLHQFSVWDIMEDSHGDLWFTSVSGGVSRFDGESFTLYSYKEGLAGFQVRSMLEDSRGYLWFGTNGGVSRYDGQDFISYTVEDGLSHPFVISLIEDKQGNIWVSTENGITLFVPDSTAAPSAIGLEQVGYRILNFGKADGLKQLSFSQNSVYLDRQDRIWWGSEDGLTMLDLHQFSVPAEPPKHLQLTHIEVEQQFIDYRRLGNTSYGEQFWFREDLSQAFDSVVAFSNYPATMSLPYNVNHLTFHFTAIDWTAPNSIEYQYFMEGLDKDWSVPQSENKVDYRNMPYGTFTLHAKARGANSAPGEWSKPFKYTFSIHPPWWHTSWAYMAYALTLFVAVYFFIKWRTYSLRRQRQLLRSRVAEQTQELRSAYKQATQAKEAALAAEASAKAANEAKSTFLSTVSHELRTPLTSIIGFTKLNKKNLEEKVLPEIKEEAVKAKKSADRITKNLEVVESEGQRLTKLINQLLDLAKIESGKVEWKMTDVHPARLITRAVNATNALFEQKNGLQLIEEVPEDLPNITADEDRLLQVLINLISNAVKFTDSGFIKIGARETPGVAPRELTFFVEDSGSGIPADQLDQVFERFRQVVDNQAGKPKGTGLGLPICKEIVEHHGGKIWVESDPDSDREEKGSTFFFTLPIQNNRTDA